MHVDASIRMSRTNVKSLSKKAASSKLVRVLKWLIQIKTDKKIVQEG